MIEPGADNPYRAPRSRVGELEEPALVPGDGPAGIGGWLVLPILGLIATIVRLGTWLISEYLKPLSEPGAWDGIAPAFKPLILFEIVTNAAFLTAAAVLLVLCFRKSRHFPRGMVMFLAANVIVVLADYAWSSKLAVIDAATQTEVMREIVRGVVGASIWIPYFLTSKRVRNTFIK